MKILLLTLFAFGSLLAQTDLEKQFNYAKSLFDSEDYFDAVTEFKRLMFFDEKGDYRIRSEYFTGLSYKKGGFYSEAINYFAASEMKLSDPDSLFLIKTETIKSNILRRTIPRAFQLIDELSGKYPDPDKTKEINTLRAFAYVFSDQWLNAAEYFRLSGYPELADLAIKTNEEKYSVTKAKILSALIPGAGQIYTGNYLNGIMSFALNAATVYLSINSFIEDRVFDGVITANFLWLRFYSGGISNAGKFAEENNILINNKALKYLQDNAAVGI
jgi:hypothetical protein